MLWPEALSSSSAKVGDVVNGTLEQPLAADGTIVAGTGAPARVRVVSVEPPSKGGGARLTLELESIQAQDRPIDVHARLILIGRKSTSKFRRALRSVGEVVGVVLVGPRRRNQGTNAEEAEYTGISAIETPDGSVEIPARAVAVFRTTEASNVALQRGDPPWKYQSGRR